MPFISGNFGGGTLAGKVAHQIEKNRAASELSDAEDAVAPHGSQGAEDGDGTYANGHMTATDAGSFDDDGPSWPDETAERAFLAQQSVGAAPGSSTAAAPSDNEEMDSANLPPLDSLVARIPLETRKMLDELFRAEFKTVRKIPQRLLK